MGSRLTALVIKPTLKCTAKCRNCSCRRILHRSARDQEWLSFSDWLRILREAVSLGTRNLVISGGEPTLYNKLVELVYEASQLGFHVKLNSNGSGFSEELARETVQAGVNTVCISIYSHRPEVHNRIRQNPRLWSQACRSMELLRSLKKEYPSLSVETQSVVLRENYGSLDKLLQFHYELGSERVLLSYLEGDFAKEHLLNESEISELREKVLPSMRAFCLKLSARVRGSALSALEKIYDPTIASLNQFSQGRYWNAESCTVSRREALILATGDVHPCSIVEYLHRPVMGNLFRNTLPELWRSQAWSEFRSSRLQECVLCPMNIHVSVPLRSPDPLRSFAQRVRRKAKALKARISFRSQ